MAEVRDGTQQLLQAEDEFERRVLAARVAGFFVLQAVIALVLIGAYAFGKLNGIELNGGFEILVGGVGTYLFGLYNMSKPR